MEGVHSQVLVHKLRNKCPALIINLECINMDKSGSRYLYAALEAGLRRWGAGIEYECEACGFGAQPQKRMPRTCC